MSFLENIDKNKLQKIVLIVISALTLAAITLLLTIIVLSIRPQSPAGPTGIEFNTVAVTDKDVNMGALMLAGENHPFTASDALKETLVNCQVYRNEHRGDAAKGPYYTMNDLKMVDVAMEAAHKLLTDAEAAVGEDNVLIKLAFAEDSQNAEYATGLLMFLTDYDENKLPESYATWLKANAAKYGFVESFEDAYRYVGVTHATYMAEKELTLADYINYLKKNHSADKKMLEVGDYGVYYVSCKAGDSINVPANNEYTVSGTNEGGVIVTVKLK